MKGNRATYRPLSEIVQDALTDNNCGNHEYFRFLRWGIKYAEELKYDFVRELKTVELTMKDWKAIQLPDDCVSWVSVGMKSGEKVITITKSNKIALTHDYSNNNKVENSKNQPIIDYATQGNGYYYGIIPFLNINSYGEDTGRLFGMTEKETNMIRVTENTNGSINELQFSGGDSISKKIQLTYISTAIDPSQETFISPLFAEYIVAGINTEYHKFKPNTSAFTIANMENELQRQYFRVLDHSWDMSVDDVMEYLRYGYSLTPRTP